jgi:hypothetical protein
MTGTDMNAKPTKLSTFQVNPEVMNSIRAMQNRDCVQVAKLHIAAMGDSLWAKLGHRFLTELYKGLVDSPYFLGFVYEDFHTDKSSYIRGFIGGSTDTGAMMSDLFKSRWSILALSALPRLISSPSLFSKLLETGRYSTRSASSGDHTPGESLFCSFEPELRGKRVSGHINKVLFDDLLARGHKRVKVTTETDNLGANRQLTSWGFERQDVFKFYGKEMVRYVLDLESCDRVDPISRHPAV